MPHDIKTVISIKSDDDFRYICLYFHLIMYYIVRIYTEVLTCFTFKGKTVRCLISCAFVA